MTSDLNNLDNINNLHQLRNFFEHNIESEIGTFGGRTFYIKDGNQKATDSVTGKPYSYKMNTLLNKTETLLEKWKSSGHYQLKKEEIKDLNYIIGRLKEIDSKGSEKLDKNNPERVNILKRLLTLLRQILGNRFDRVNAYKQLEKFASQAAVIPSTYFKDDMQLKETEIEKKPKKFEELDLATKHLKQQPKKPTKSKTPKPKGTEIERILSKTDENVEASKKYLDDLGAKDVKKKSREFRKPAQPVKKPTITERLKGWIPLRKKTPS